MPERIQRKRTKGWKMPPNTVYVGRPTVWGNPYDHREYGAERAVKQFKMLVETEDIWLSPLRGKNLACWCSLDRPCHADVLLELANPTTTGQQ